MIDWASVVINKSGTYPDVLAIDSTGAATPDGTEFIAEYINNGIFGPTQAFLDYAGLVPNGVTESAASGSQWIESVQLGNGIGPGIYVQWAKVDDPSVTGDRVLLLSGQGILRASYPLLDSAVWVGAGANPTADFFYRADDAAGTTRNSAGIYLILPDSYDWVYPSAPRSTTSFWHTVNGYGATNTKVQKFLTQVVASNDIVVTVTNLTGPSADDGFRILANMDCFLSVVYVPNGNAKMHGGISKNSTQFTTNIELITSADRMSLTKTIGANEPTQAIFSNDISSGDIIVPHADGVADGASPALGSIQIYAQEKTKTTNTIWGITY